MGIQLFCLTAAVFVAFWREEFIDREAHFLKHVTGVFGVRAALLGGHTEIINRHQHLHITDELNDGEYPQRHEYHLFGVVVHETAAETLAYAYRNTASTAIALATAVAFFHQPCRQNNRFCHLYRAARHIASRHFLTVTVIGAELACKYFDIALTTKKNDLLLENCNAID